MSFSGKRELWLEGRLRERIEWREGWESATKWHWEGIDREHSIVEAKSRPYSPDQSSSKAISTSPSAVGSHAHLITTGQAQRDVKGTIQRVVEAEELGLDFLWEEQGE